VFWVIPLFWGQFWDMKRGQGKSIGAWINVWGTILGLSKKWFGDKPTDLNFLNLYRDNIGKRHSVTKSQGPRLPRASTPERQGVNLLRFLEQEKQLNTNMSIKGAVYFQFFSFSRCVFCFSLSTHLTLCLSQKRWRCWKMIGEQLLGIPVSSKLGW
jgi:hypothetical protein